MFPWYYHFNCVALVIKRRKEVPFIQGTCHNLWAIITSKPASKGGDLPGSYRPAEWFISVAFIPTYLEITIYNNHNQWNYMKQVRDNSDQCKENWKDHQQLLFRIGGSWMNEDWGKMIPLYIAEG